jgi:hypothetical protein
MKIQMPESIDIFALVAANLPGFKATLGCLRSRTVNRPPARTLEQPMTFHVTQEGDVGGHGTGLRLLFHHHGQVVEMICGVSHIILNVASLVMWRKHRIPLVLLGFGLFYAT